MGNTNIEWTRGDDGTPGKTWNPIRGCSRVSTGCENCYAETTAARFRKKGLPYEGLTTDRGNWNGNIMWVPDHLNDPLKWKDPKRIFVNSMSDLWHHNVSDWMLKEIFHVMSQAHWHTFIILTKRADRQLEWMRAYVLRNGSVPKNVIFGVTAENQETYDDRVRKLRMTPAWRRAVSMEPLLGPIVLDEDTFYCEECGRTADDWDSVKFQHCDPPTIQPLPPIDWVIVGGESGHNRRPIELENARALMYQCRQEGVSFFMKQVDKIIEIPPDLMVREFPELPA